MSAMDFLPHPGLESHAQTLRSHVESLADGLSPEEFHLVLDSSMKCSFRDVLDLLSASEGSIWIASLREEILTPVFNTGPRAADFVLKHRQPLGRGIVSSVYLTQIGTMERDVYKNTLHDPSANERHKVLTCAMVVVPFYFASRVRGVLSAVKLKSAGATEPDPPPFGADALQRLNHASSLLGSAVDLRLFKSAFGLP